MLELEYLAKVAYLLEKTPQGRQVPPEAIQASIPLALRAVSRMIAESGEYALQQTEATATLTNGAAPIPADMLADRIETVLHPDIDGAGTDQYFSRIPDGTRADLAGAVNLLFPPYVIENGTIYCSLGGGGWPDANDLPPNTAALKITGSQVATLANITGQWEAEVVKQGAFFAQTTMEAAA